MLEMKLGMDENPRYSIFMCVPDKGESQGPELGGYTRRSEVERACKGQGLEAKGQGVRTHSRSL